MSRLPGLMDRGPVLPGIGWHGGYSILKKNRETADGKNPEPTNPIRQDEIEKQNASSDMEKQPHHDQHEHHHRRDNQEAVNRTGPEKGLELAAAEDTNDDAGSDKSKDDISPVSVKKGPDV